MDLTRSEADAPLERQSISNFPHNTLFQGLNKVHARVVAACLPLKWEQQGRLRHLFFTWKIQSSNPAGSPDNGNSRSRDRLPFQPPACTHKRPSGLRS